MVVNRLLAFAQDSTQRSDLEDDLKSHALHILRSLTHDSGLAQDIFPYLRVLLNLCLENFNSAKWSVRNASLQLFGKILLSVFSKKIHSK